MVNNSIGNLQEIELKKRMICRSSGDYTKDYLLQKLKSTGNLSGSEIKILLGFFSESN